MICKECGKEIKDGSIYCANCGAQVEIKRSLNGTEIFCTVISIIVTILGVCTLNGYLCLWGFSSVIIGAFCKRIAYEKGYEGGFGYGWFFLILGLIAVLAFPSKKKTNIEVKNETVVPDKYDQVKKLKELLDSGAITEEEFKKEKEKLLK